MYFETSREAALKKLKTFVSEGLPDYTKMRNYDLGPKDKTNVSCLSPFITHGLLNEVEIIKEVLKTGSMNKYEKFIQEVLWRVYWKGWLELRPDVWRSYLDDLEKRKKEFETKNKYLNAIKGETEIKCFNDWVKELKENNYLHNHTRMWFASIWIFTLDLPWELGAEFFMKYLFDGDSASNTLGWRWVAGIQTKGKHYLAQEWNINKFTNNRYENIKLNENAAPKITDKVYAVKNLNLNNNIFKKKPLLIFENSLCFEESKFKDEEFDKILIIKNGNSNRKLKMDEKLLTFKENLIKDQFDRLKRKSCNCEIIEIEDLKKISGEVNILYPCVGENLDFLYTHKHKNISFLYREIDQIAWKYCNKGFFNFKNYIPKIVEGIRL